MRLVRDDFLRAWFFGRGFIARKTGVRGDIANEVSRRSPRLVLGPVAQLGERLVCIQEVVGSIPVRSTKNLPESNRAYSSVWLERTPDKREVGGSNPPRPTIVQALSCWDVPRDMQPAQGLERVL